MWTDADRSWSTVMLMLLLLLLMMMMIMMMIMMTTTRRCYRPICVLCDLFVRTKIWYGNK